MNKPLVRFLLVLAALSVSACSEKKQYEAAVLAEMQSEPDIKDYKLDPQRMAECVVEGTSRKMPGIFAGDPARMKAYLSYAKLLSIPKAKDPQKMMAELREEFGSPQGLFEARNNYSEHLVECQTILLAERPPEETETPATPEAPAPVVAPAVTPAPAPVAVPQTVAPGVPVK